LAFWDGRGAPRNSGPRDRFPAGFAPVELKASKTPENTEKKGKRDAVQDEPESRISSRPF
jgi:hypothetical protein